LRFWVSSQGDSIKTSMFEENCTVLVAIGVGLLRPLFQGIADCAKRFAVKTPIHQEADRIRTFLFVPT
jgi:hypothetical protein